MLTPTAEQESAIVEMVSSPAKAALLAADTGAGKTLMSVETARRIGAKTILVIGPVSAKVSNAWRKSFEAQGVDLPFRKITSDTVEEFQNLKDSVPGVYYIGREFFTVSGTDATKKDKTGKVIKTRSARWSWKKVNPDMAIFDEVQTASNRQSSTYYALSQLKAGFKIASSATPNRNKFSGLWSITRWLFGDVVDPSFNRWSDTWAVTRLDTVKVRGEVRRFKVVEGEKNPGEFVSTLPCYIRINADKVPVETRVVRVNLTPIQRKIYNEMESSALAWIESHPLVADISLVQRIRLRQITLGEPTLVDNGRVSDLGETLYDVVFNEDCQSSKLDALMKILRKERGKRVVIWVDSQKFARVTAARLGPTAREWSGVVSQGDREVIFQEFLDGTVQYIVAVVAALAEGVDGLQTVCNTEVWLNESPDEMMNTQAQGRLNRRGQEADFIVQYKIIAHDTDDDNHFASLVQARIDRRRELAK